MFLYDFGYEKDLSEFGLEEITKEFVKHEIFDLIKQSFSNNRASSEYYHVNRWK